ncbi:MAG TPA: glycosyltransferase family 2 protein [Thermoleophilaceae bacterium]|nr:glycosyltransferase family 2 protein [Thermoleophilaceae bacterium]
MRSFARRLRGAAYDGLRLVLGVPWITGRLGGVIDDGRRQTRLGAFFDRRPLLLRSLAIVALIWGAVYLTWRVGWSGEGANPVVFAMLLVTELYGVYALAMLAWFSWSRPAAARPPVTTQHAVDVYVCTYDEPVEVVLATLAGCRALTYPHTTYLLDDGRRPEMEELARLSGARYLTRPDNSHAKAGNINAALPRTEGELVFVLDADHVPMPDALDTLVGYFDDDRMAVVQSPHDFSNHDSVQHYMVGRHEQSLFYRVICPGKDRHGAAFWCGSAALIRRRALLDIGGVATETIAEDFHTTIRLQRHGWRSRYHDEVLVQGLAPHDLDGYLLQRDRWARGNLAVFTLPESPLRARELAPAQRLSYLASLFAYLAPPMRLLLLTTLAVVLWTGALPMKLSVAALAVLWLPSVVLNLAAGSALARGYMRIAETTHFELLTMEIYTRALRCAVIPGKTAFKVTPKQGVDEGGWRAVMKLRLVALCAIVLAAGIAVRGVDIFGPALIPSLPGVAAVIVPLLALIELRRVLRTLVLAGARRQRRLVYRFEGVDARAHTFAGARPVLGRVVDASASGLGLVMDRPLKVGSRPLVRLRLPDATGAEHDVPVRVEVRSSRSAGESTVIGASIVSIDPESRLRLMEWCYVVCSHERLRGHRPAAPADTLPAPIVFPVEDTDTAPVHVFAPDAEGASAAATA